MKGFANLGVAEKEKNKKHPFSFPVNQTTYLTLKQILVMIIASVGI